MTKLLLGKPVAEKIYSYIKEKLESEPEYTPTLAIIRVGDDFASNVYVRNKTRACQQCGIQYKDIVFPATIKEYELQRQIELLNDDTTIDGILVQLPLPDGFDEQSILDTVSPGKDVDGFSHWSIARQATGCNFYCLPHQPCTARGIISLLKHYNIPIAGKHVVIIGRSNIVGKPLARLMLNENATVTVCHSKTTNLPEITKTADILVSAVGKRCFVTADMVKDGAVVVDVGINRDKNGRVTGDVDFDAVKDKASAITPVPGGVGPMTVAMLMLNTMGE